MLSNKVISDIKLLISRIVWIRMCKRCIQNLCSNSPYMYKRDLARDTWICLTPINPGDRPLLQSGVVMNEIS